MTADHSKAAAWPEETHRKPRLFRTGNIVATPGALELLRHLEVSALGYLFRHMNGDWGDLDAEDKQANQGALVYGSRIFSSYALPDGKNKLWIITEADRLFIIKGGRSAFIKLVFAKNELNGRNADVPSRFYLRNPMS